MSNFATADQIAEIGNLLSDTEWNKAVDKPKFVARAAVLNLMVGWAHDWEQAPSAIKNVMNSDHVGERVNQGLDFIRTGIDEDQFLYMHLDKVGATNLISWLRRQAGQSVEPVASNDEAWVARKDQELADERDIRPQTTAHKADVELEDGMYRRGDGVIFKVYKTQRGHQVAKRLVVEQGAEGADATVWFEYDGKRPLCTLTAEMRMTYEDAKEFGVIYGVCCICSRTLTDELSVYLGIGPVCGKREFGEGFKFTVKAARKELKNKETDQMQLGE